MTDGKFDKATAVAIFRMADLHDSCTVLDDGVFLNEEFRVHSPADTVFDWTPAYDMDWPGSLNPITAPVLPIPFTASELAACMLDGPGSSIQEALERRIGFALDENDVALAELPLSMREVRNALRDAYAIAAEAQKQVGEFDYDDELKAQSLSRQYDDANGKANMRECVFEHGITRAEIALRRARAVESVAELKSQAQQSHAAVKDKWFAWRKSMVRQLLQPKAVLSGIVALVAETEFAVDSAPKDADVSTRVTEPGASVTVPSMKLQPAATGPTFSMTRAAMIEQHKHEWPTIETDMKAAKRNGLHAAMAGARGWHERLAMEWARANNRLTSIDKPAHALAGAINGMARLPTSWKHTLEG